MDKSDIWKTSVASLESSLSVILVLFYGYVANIFQWLDDSSEKKVTSLCVNVFLPAMLVAVMGPYLTIDSILTYWPIIFFGIIELIINYSIGHVAFLFFNIPEYVVPAIIFNNATALPLLLISSLSKIGALDSIVKDNETTSEALERARAFILMYSIFSNITRFSLGPFMFTRARNQEPLYISNDNPNDQPGIDSIDNNDSTPLLQRPIVNKISKWNNKKVKKIKNFIIEHSNAAILACLVAIIVGITPPLHYFFFEFKFIRASFMESILNIGELYPVLNLFVLGYQLRSKAQNTLHVGAFIFIFIIRFVLAPIISIGGVYLLRSYYPNLWDRDPMLDFIVMFISAGPPAVSLGAVAQLSGASDEEISSIAKMLLIVYGLTPFVMPTVVLSIFVDHKIYKN